MQIFTDNKPYSKYFPKSSIQVMKNTSLCKLNK